MTYTLNEYYQYTNSTATRVEVYFANSAAANLLAHHKQNGVIEIPVCDCVDGTVAKLPMPDALMKTLDSKIIAINKRVVVTGIDAYLSLVEKQNVNAFMVALHSRIDESKLNVVYMLNDVHFDNQKFLNPKYEGSLSVVRISNNGQYLAPLEVTVVSDKWVRCGNNPTNWNALLKTLDKFEPTGEYTLVLEDFGIKQAGLSSHVSQLIDIYEVAKRYYGLSDILPKNELELLLTKSKETNIAPIDFLKAEFGQDNLNTRLAIKRLIDLQGDALWTSYIWALQKSIENDSYLARVINDNITPYTLLKKYVSDTAVVALSCRNANKYASERATAIRELSGLADSLIIEFIGRTNELPSESIACWLNCGTDAEQIEIVRRVAESDLTVGLPQIWRSLYPALADYLSDDYDYTDNDLSEYFRDYRRFKISNTITDTFVKKAFNSVLPSTFVTRDSLLQELSVDVNTALLVVDGMGAEYFPLVLAMARRRGLSIESTAVATVRLPSSTEFNQMQWVDGRVIKPEIHEVDNVSHDGAIKYEKCSPSHNIVATLSVFDTIFNRIASGLTEYDRVVLTADHGSSRLAVIAHEKKLDTKLEWNGEPQNWRYSIAPTNTERPVEFESYYDVENSVTYWIVRGYNRLPKKGGKLSVHGGATLEERLVPVIVFTKAKVAVAQNQNNEKPTEQLVERMGFDDI